MLEDDIQKDLKVLSIADVSKKYNLSLDELFKLTSKLNKRNSVKVNKDSYIARTPSRKWAVRKSIDGKMYYFGTYKLKKEAMSVVQRLVEVDWNVEELPRILDELGIERCR